MICIIQLHMHRVVEARQMTQNSNFPILLRLLSLKLYSNTSVINNKYIAMCLFFLDKSIVLFELFESLVKGHRQIKGPHYYQGQASSGRKKLYHICQHGILSTMRFLPSCIHRSLKHRPEAISPDKTQPTTST